MNPKTSIKLEENKEFENVWNGAESFVWSPIQSYEWIRACTDSFVDADKLNVISLKNNGSICGIAALCPSQEHNNVLEQIGVEMLHEPVDFIYKDETSLSMLLDCLSKSGHPLYLRRVPRDSLLFKLVKQSYRYRGLVFVRPRVSYPYIELGGACEDICDCLPKRHCSDMRRKQRKAESLGEVRYEIHAPKNTGEFLPLFEQALQIEAKSWKGQEGTALKSDAVYREFYHNFGVRASKSGFMRVCFLLIDDVPIAMQLAVEFKNRFWLLKIGYDDNFSNCSPGGLLMLHTLTYAKERGLASYEFLGTSAPWTKRWTEKERLSYALRVYPFNLVGLMSLAGNVSRKIKKKLR